MLIKVLGRSGEFTAEELAEEFLVTGLAESDYDNDIEEHLHDSYDMATLIHALRGPEDRREQLYNELISEIASEIEYHVESGDWYQDYEEIDW